MKTPPEKNFRLQGTDGIRSEVRRSDDPEVARLTPLAAFRERGVITEAFMEAYACAHVRSLFEAGEVGKNDRFVVGWDPRDPEGVFTEAVVRGIRKAGLTALVLGVVPTPLVPMYALHVHAAGGFMVTASHNPKDQNGIKTFLAFRGMKLLPENDIALTRSLMKQPSIGRKPLIGKRLDCRQAALDLFMEFTLDPVNSWAGDVSFGDIVLAVDPARGALSGLAAQAFRRAGFGEVVEVNPARNGEVNLRSGVADLEGHGFLSAASIDPATGAFARYPAVLKLFELGRRHRRRIQAGRIKVCGAVFDADGDRFYRLDYHPGKDGLIVLSGDETAFHQARYLMRRDPESSRGAAYLNTVESDLNAAHAAEKLGFRAMISPVGDKWILLRVALLLAEARLNGLRAPGLNRELKSLWRADRPDVNALRRLEARISALEASRGLAVGDPSRLRVPFAVGSEETGHNITLGWLRGSDGARLPVFFGNGLKSALNTFAATQVLLAGKTGDAAWRALARPFAAGFKHTSYVYYIRKERFYSDSPVWRRVLGALRKQARTLGYRCRKVVYGEDRDMMYLALERPGGGPAAIFIRNSGTENKISVNLRCARRERKALQAIGEEAIRLLFRDMKDAASALAQLERELLQRAAARPLPEAEVTAPPGPRVLMEMGKQGLIRNTARGLVLTDRGKWFITGR